MTANRLTIANYLEQCGTSVALGSPIQNMDVLLVGTKPDEGEIVIVGPQVALGYLNDPARTDQAFRAITVGASLKTGYFTGDWAERRDGRLFFKQRFDRQVKIRGFRIELDEIEAAVRGLGWTSCSVFKWGNMLAAVVEKEPGSMFALSGANWLACSKTTRYRRSSRRSKRCHITKTKNWTSRKL